LLLSGLDVKLGDLNLSFNYYANKEVNEFSERSQMTIQMS